ncbi:UbiD family decarboxylase [Sedimentitalea sp. XS_ASV28]|uniref:UbiD family decarboxylase n=1 Tax=Sedimentitalea sp. XS_ASV28 TaxID=3241296 RepID=UPI003515BD0D
MLMTETQNFHPQDVRHFLAEYTAGHPGDVIEIDQQVSDDQDATALIWALAAQGRQPLLRLNKVAHLDMPVLCNVFGSRQRIARLFGTDEPGLHAEYQQRSRAAVPPRLVEDGPVLERMISGEEVDLNLLPMLQHFETDRKKYITSGMILGENPESGIGNLSYHRAMIHAKNQLATSLHSRGHLWRLLNMSKELGKPMPVAMIIGGHPLFMLAASARLSFEEDERDIAGGLMGAPLEVVKTPKYGIRVPAHAEIVLEGVIDHEATVEEGPFGEFTGYSSDRSTNNLFTVETILRRNAPILVSVAGGNSAEHLNLGRIPREAEMVEKLRARFPSVTAVHYPASGTHFHAYVAINQSREGEARQVMLGLLGWDQYLKNVIVVDADVDITRDEEVLWAVSSHFQPHRDVVIVEGLPGNALDPSASGIGTTSRMGLDATRGPDFHGTRARISPEAQTRAAALLQGLSG